MEKSWRTGVQSRAECGRREVGGFYSTELNPIQISNSTQTRALLILIPRRNFFCPKSMDSFFVSFAFPLENSIYWAVHGAGVRFFVWKTYFEILGGNFDCFHPMSWKCSNWFRHPVSLQICLVVVDQKVNHSNKSAMNRLGIWFKASWNIRPCSVYI